MRNCRALVADDENDQAATKDAFEVLHFIAAKRLAAGRLTVIDATNVQPSSRKPLIELARKYHCLPVAIVFNLPEKLFHARNRNRADRDFGPHVIRQQTDQMLRSLSKLKKEGFRHVYIAKSTEDIENAYIERQPLWNNLSNHDMKLMRKLRGKNVAIKYGLAESLEQLEREPSEFINDVTDFIDSLVSHYVLDEGKLVIAHAGLPESMQGRGSAKVRDFALYGQTTGETDEFGLPVRYDWASEYRGKAIVVYGHTPVPELVWMNNTINIDTGCVFGGKLTALRYPEKELISVNARKTYYEPAKPFLPEEGDTGAAAITEMRGDILDIEDVTGKRIVNTRLHRNITIREENAIAALEVMSRFAADPHWLIYLPPTMSPSETSSESGLLEHPAEAFAYYRNQGVAQVVCEEKHMGSRAVVIVGRDAAATKKRFGITDEAAGICYTRTGRRFFEDKALEIEFLDRIRLAMDRSRLWEEFDTDWICLDCELMPWSAKAQALIKEQYAAVGAAGESAFGKADSPAACS